jgi:hypothetical protein
MIIPNILISSSLPEYLLVNTAVSLKINKKQSNLPKNDPELSDPIE